jgi:hypothetical protein
MRIADDLRRCVVFIGHSGGPPDYGFTPAGTGFLISYKGQAYLVTAQHVAVELGDDPFAIRVNRRDGTSENITIDPLQESLRWFCNTDDDTVDLAIAPFDYNIWRQIHDLRMVEQRYFTEQKEIDEWDIGVGDACYAIGLFRLMAGKTRNLPIVHTGNIALMPSDERIPVRNWIDRSPSAEPKYIEAYLVELQNLPGLSGAPVFVRPGANFDNLRTDKGEKVRCRFSRSEVLLLGIWQGSWDAPPNEVLAFARGMQTRVPVGMGSVVPSAKMLEILEMPALQAHREDRARIIELQNAASLDILVSESKST